MACYRSTPKAQAKFVDAVASVLVDAQASDFSKLKNGESMLYILWHLNQMHLVPSRVLTLETVTLRNKEGSCLIDWAARYGKLSELPQVLCTLDRLLIPHPQSGVNPLAHAIWMGYSNQVSFLNPEAWVLLSQSERDSIIQLVGQMEKDKMRKVPIEVLALISQDCPQIDTRKWETL